MSQDTTAQEPKPITPEDIHMPPNSFWPIVLALGFTLILAGLAINPAMAIVGVVMCLVSAVGWVIEPVHLGDDEHH